MSAANFSGDEEFRPIKPKKEYYEKPTGRPGDNYEPIRPEYEKDEDDGDWADREFKQQISNTASFLSEKTLRKEDQIFYILSAALTPSSPQLEKSLNRLSATILSYLDDKHQRILASGSHQILNQLVDGTIPKYLEETFHMLRPLRLTDNLSGMLKKWIKGKRLVIIATYPNLDVEISREYIKEIKQFLRKRDTPIFDLEILNESFVFADADFDVIKELAIKSTFVYRIYQMPKAIIEKIKTTNKNKKATLSAGSLSEFPIIQTDKLPIVTVMDSGVNDIPQLKKLLVKRDWFIGSNADDDAENGGHGTSVATLVTFGEQLQQPIAKIISYKIWQPTSRERGYDGMIEGINKFSNISRIFVSCVNFEEDFDEELLKNLNQLVQEKNICFISSAGNLPPNDTVNFVMKRIPHQQYRDKYPVLSPSDAPFIVSVGSIAKKITNKPGSVSASEINSISPFSRCGFKNRSLLNSKKPEVVEHGGNVNRNSSNVDAEQVGVTTFDKTGRAVSNTIGTSFAAPLFARKIAGLMAKYHGVIKNAETLKAISIISRTPHTDSCAGFGEPREFIGCGHDYALYFAEGLIKLPERKTGKWNINYDKIDFKVPSSVGSIDVCLVHSDDFKIANKASLNTYLKPEMTKWDRESSIDPENKEMKDAMTNVKILRYQYKRNSMKSLWTLKITPAMTADVTPSLQKEITVRYGCAILLTRKSTKSSLYSINQDIDRMRID